jgi:hypothetical protein
MIPKSTLAALAGVIASGRPSPDEETGMPVDPATAGVYDRMSHAVFARAVEVPARFGGLIEQASPIRPAHVARQRGAGDVCEGFAVDRRGSMPSPAIVPGVFRPCPQRGGRPSWSQPCLATACRRSAERRRWPPAARRAFAPMPRLCVRRLSRAPKAA